MNSFEQYYAKRATSYDNIYQKPERVAHVKELHKELPPHFENKKVLDIGCGTGYWTQYISHTASSIMGIDINPEVLALAQAKSYACPVQFEVASYKDLHPYSKGFSAAFAGFVFSHIPKQEARTFIHSVLNLLPPGSVFVILDNLFVTGSNSPISRTDEQGNTYQIRSLPSGEEFEIMKNFPTEEKLLSTIASDSVNWEYKSFKYFWLAQIKLPE